MSMIKRIKRTVKYRLTVWENSVRLRQSRNAIRSFKDKYDGKRCFIVGNGPSLTLQDLQVLKDNKELCFGSHRIYHIFENTEWRPDFYCAQDAKLINSDAQHISMQTIKDKFIAIVPNRSYHSIRNAKYVSINLEEFYPKFPRFSEDVSHEIFEGYTVTYMCIQLAVYMGFSEIYLLGVDHSYSIELNPDGTIKQDDSKKDHFSDKDTIVNIPQTYKSTLAYYAARRYADKNGIKIVNVTRGGKLDAFQRADFDDLFSDGSQHK